MLSSLILIIETFLFFEARLGWRQVIQWLILCPTLLRRQNIQINVGFFSCVFLQDNREMDRNEGLKFARKHSMLFIGKLVYMYSRSGETVGRTRYSVFRWTLPGIYFFSLLLFIFHRVILCLIRSTFTCLRPVFYQAKIRVPIIHRVLNIREPELIKLKFYSKNPENEDVDMFLRCVNHRTRCVIWPAAACRSRRVGPWTMPCALHWRHRRCIRASCPWTLGSGVSKRET